MKHKEIWIIRSEMIRDDLTGIWLTSRRFPSLQRPRQWRRWRRSASRQAKRPPRPAPSPRLHQQLIRLQVWPHGGESEHSHPVLQTLLKVLTANLTVICSFVQVNSLYSGDSGSIQVNAMNAPNNSTLQVKLIMKQSKQSKNDIHSIRIFLKQLCFMMKVVLILYCIEVNMYRVSKTRITVFFGTPCKYRVSQKQCSNVWEAITLAKMAL